MRKLPKGISNYEELVDEGRIYVDKTMYIEKLEELSDKRIMFLRPRKFGKTLFTSTLENYYDILKANKFEKLFSNTYIGQNPTEKRNSYYVLRFNFSGISTADIESTINGFRREIASSVELFVEKYRINFYITEENKAEDILDNLIKAFEIQKADEKIYVIIDEYDHFANELLGFRTDDFKNLISRNGQIRKWFEILKKGTESVVDRIFITGVAPVTLDSTTSGFNIANDLTKNINFNDMLGFCEEDVKYLMTELEIDRETQSKLLPIIKTNYDGYVFSNEIDTNIEKYRMYNSNMTLYFLNSYKEQGKIPEKLVDVNIISDYGKIESLMDLCRNITKKEILEKIVAGETVESEITEKFNSDIGFGEKELISLLYYLGYLTIKGKEFGLIQFGVPNEVIRKIYNEYYVEYIKRMAGITESLEIGTMTRQVLLEGKIEKIIETLKQYLTGLSNRDYKRFAEKDIQLLFYAICRQLKEVFVKTEQEVEGKYTDILIKPTEKIEERYGILVEFKYIKKEDYTENLLKQKQEEAKEQLKMYKNTEEIKLLPKLNCYSVVAVKNELYVEEVK